MTESQSLVAARKNIQSPSCAGPLRNLQQEEGEGSQNLVPRKEANTELLEVSVVQEDTDNVPLCFRKELLKIVQHS